MDEGLKRQAEQFDLQSLKDSLNKHDENIASLRMAIEHQHQFISQEENMIDVINRPDNTADPKLIEIDTARLKDSIAAHRVDISVFEGGIKEEEARKRDTETMIIYLEIQRQ